jgi:hypothetical protein
VDRTARLESDRPVSVETSYCHSALSGSLSVRSRSLGAIKRALVRDGAIIRRSVSHGKGLRQGVISEQSDLSVARYTVK